MKQTGWQRDDTRNASMRRALGDQANRLIKNDQWLPKYRNRQNTYPKEWQQSLDYVEAEAKKGRIRNAEAYLATIWAKENIMATVKKMQTMIARAISWIAEKRRQFGDMQRDKKAQRETNAAGQERLAQLKAQHFTAATAFRS